MGSGVDEVGCQECGSRSALLCSLWKMNRSVAGWVQAGIHISIDLYVRKD